MQPAALESALPSGEARLVFALDALRPGIVAREACRALWRALREQEKRRHRLTYRLAMRLGAVGRGEPACWMAVTGASAQQLLDAARLFHVLLRRHVPVFGEASPESGQDVDPTPLLEDLERRGGWRIPVSGALELLREPLKNVPAQALLPFPRLRLGRIYVMCKDDRLHEAESEWRHFRRDLALGRYPQLPAWEVGLVRELVAGYAESPITQARYAYLERLARQIPLDEAGARGIVHNCTCFMAIHAGDLPLALSAGDAAMRAFDSADSAYGRLFIHYQRGMALAAAGRLDEARRDYRKGLALSRRQGSATHELPSIGLALLAGLDYLDNRLGPAARALDAALDPIEQGESWSHLLWRVYRTRIGLAALEHDAAALQRVLRHGRASARARGFRRLETQLSLLEIEIDLRQGAWDAARLRARELQLATLAQRPPERDLAWRQTILYARYLLLSLRLPHAQATDRQQADALAREARRLHDFELRIHALLLRAQIDLRLQDPDNAFAAVEEALGLLLPQRPVRLLLDHPGVAGLLAAYRRTARRRQAGRRLQGWLGELEQAARADARLAFSRAHRLALTGRELELLRELAQGRRNKEIAQRLRCSENTVKFHLKRLNAKFSTHKRTELLARAREAGYLD